MPIRFLNKDYNSKRFTQASVIVEEVVVKRGKEVIFYKRIGLPKIKYLYIYFTPYLKRNLYDQKIATDSFTFSY